MKRAGGSRPEVDAAIAAFLGYDPEPFEERSVSELLRAKRRKLGLTQHEVATRLGADPTAVAGWENGDIVLRKRRRLELGLSQK